MILFQSNQMHNKICLPVSIGLATVSAASQHFEHDSFRTVLLYVIHFSFSVTIRLRNGSISFRLAKILRMEIQSIVLFASIREPSKLRASLNCSSWAMLWLLICRSTSITSMISSTFSITGLLLRGASLTLKILKLHLLLLLLYFFYENAFSSSCKNLGWNYSFTWNRVFDIDFFKIRVHLGYVLN